MQESFTLVSVVLFNTVSFKYGNVFGYFWRSWDFELHVWGYKTHISQMHKVSFN